METQHKRGNIFLFYDSTWIGAGWIENRWQSNAAIQYVTPLNSVLHAPPHAHINWRQKRLRGQGRKLAT